MADQQVINNRHKYKKIQVLETKNKLAGKSEFMCAHILSKA